MAIARSSFTTGEKKRRTIRLGKLSKQAARSIAGYVDKLNDANILGQTAGPEVSRWVTEQTDALAEKLAKVGLIQSRSPQLSVALGPFLDEYLQKRVDVKAGTREVWGRAAGNLIGHFGADCDLATINEGRTDDFKLQLIGMGLAGATIHKRLEHCRMFFRSAMKRKLVAVNPFDDVTANSTKMAGREFYVTREATERIRKVCNLDWELILSLARYGGLRCPSEVLSLRWQDINWESGRIDVTSPKTAKVGKPNRVIPLFPELRDVLQRGYDAAEDGAEFVLDGKRAIAMGIKGWRNANLRTQFERLIKWTGVAPWPRLFNSQRASRETELAKEYPLHVVTSWLGNTPKIAMKHYLMTTDTDFDRASGSALHQALGRYRK